VLHRRGPAERRGPVRPRYLTERGGCPQGAIDPDRRGVRGGQAEDKGGRKTADCNCASGQKENRYASHHGAHPPTGRVRRSKRLRSRGGLAPRSSPGRRVSSRGACDQYARAGLGQPDRPDRSRPVRRTDGRREDGARQAARRDHGVGFLRFDISEYMERHTVSRLIAAAVYDFGLRSGRPVDRRDKTHSESAQVGPRIPPSCVDGRRARPELSRVSRRRGPSLVWRAHMFHAIRLVCGERSPE